MASPYNVSGCATIAKAAGAGETEYARTCASLCGWTAVILGCGSAVILNLFTAPLLRLLGATTEMLPYASTYLRILAGTNPGFASQCVGCGKCEKHCPQHINIREKLKEADHNLRSLPSKIGLNIVRKIIIR